MIFNIPGGFFNNLSSYTFFIPSVIHGVLLGMQDSVQTLHFSSVGIFMMGVITTYMYFEK